MGYARVRVALLVHLALCRHLVDAARAALDGTSGPGEGSPNEVARVGATAATASSTPVQGGIPLHQAKKLWKGIKEKMVKSKCPVPDGGTQDEACIWFTCKYAFHKAELEKTKNTLEVTHREFMGKDSEDWLLSTDTIRYKYYKIVKYAILQHDQGCDSQQKTIDDLRVWTESVFPERYECIFDVVDAYLLTHEKCDERFTHSFRQAMSRRQTMSPKCKNKSFYQNDLKSAKAGWKAKVLEVKPGLQEGLVASAGVWLGGLAVASAHFLGLLPLALSPFLGAGILAASIAFVVCEKSKKKRAGVRANTVGDKDADSLLDEPKLDAVSPSDRPRSDAVSPFDEPKSGAIPRLNAPQWDEIPLSDAK